VTFTCRDGERTWHGERIEDAVRGVLAPPVAAVGVNCTAPEHVDELLNRIRTVTDLPLVAYPNAGRAYDARSKTWSGAASSWSGDAAIVGGCCGVGPTAIAAR
jgi:homocysteine S-methyltransferase